MDKDDDIDILGLSDTDDPPHPFTIIGLSNQSSTPSSPTSDDGGIQPTKRRRTKG
ncbi:hypothetical protein HDU67_007012, partial [Dinochytrium kinnereticum]